VLDEAGNEAKDIKSFVVGLFGFVVVEIKQHIGAVVMGES